MFLLWPPRVWSQPPTPAGLRLLRLSAFLFVVISAAVGVRASVLDFRVAFERSWKTTVPAPAAAQIAAVQKAIGGEPALLLIYAGPNPWFPRMWQRVLYPKTTVILLSREQASPGKIARLRSRYGIRFAVSMDSTPPDSEFSEVRDLGPLLGSPNRVWFGPLRP